MNNKKSRIIILTFVGFLLISCNSPKKVRTEILDGLEIFPVDSLTPFLGLPINMNMYNDHLLVNDFYGEEGLIKFIDVKKGEILFSFAKKGNGPNEYLSVSNIDIFEKTGSISIGVYDVNMRKYSEYDYDDLLLKKEDVIPYSSNDVLIPYTTNEVFKVSKGYIATGFYPDGKFAILDDSLNIMKYLCDYRPKPHRDALDILNAKANLGTSSLSQDKTILAHAIFKASVLEVYDIEKDSISKKWDYIIEDIDYDIRGSDFVNNTVEGFISVNTTNQFVYALYSGEKDNFHKIAIYGTKVYKFDHDGNLINLYILDREAIDIEIKEDKLYTLIHMPEPKILIYNLN